VGSSTDNYNQDVTISFNKLLFNNSINNSRQLRVTAIKSSTRQNDDGRARSKHTHQLSHKCTFECLSVQRHATTLAVVTIITHRRTDQFFSGEAEPSLPRKISTAPKKTAMLPAKRLCPTHPTQYSWVKIPDFGHKFISSDGMNSDFFLFNEYKQNLCFIFGSWLLPEKKLAFARKTMALLDSGGLHLQPPWLVRL